jgi:hypothetical protein
VVRHRSKLLMSRIGFCISCPQSCVPGPGTMSITFSGLSDVVQSGLGARFGIGGFKDSPASVVLPVVAEGPGRVIDDTSGPDPGGPLTGYRLLPGGGTGFAALARVEPTFAAVVNSTGRGSTFSASLEQQVDLDGRPRWRVSSVSISGDGWGYQHNSSMTFLVDDDSKCIAPTTARLETKRTAPTLTARVTVDPCLCSTPGGSVGRDAVFQINYTQTSATPGLETWAVGSVTVLNGGNGYTNGSRLLFVPGDGDTVSGLLLALLVVADGVISSVSVTFGGTVFKSGVPDQVVVVAGQGGFYFKEDKSLPPIVSVPYLAVAPPLVTGLDFGVTIDEDVDSDTFGNVTNVELLNAGDNIFSWTERKTCASELNGLTVTLKSDKPDNSQPSPDPEAEGNPAVTLCVHTSFGQRGRTIKVLPADDYDHLETGIEKVAQLTSSNNYDFAIRKRVEPEVTISGGGGSGATFTTEWRRDSFLNIPLWRISRVIANGGSGYTDNNLLTVSPATSSDKVLAFSTASLRVRVKRIEPEVVVTTPCQSGGASFKVNWRLDESATPPVFRVASVEVIDGGSGYPARVPLNISESSGTIRQTASCAVGSANSSGQIQSVDVVREGSYYKLTNEAGSVTVLNPGFYYRETNDVDVADVFVEVRNLPPSDGSGAEISAAIDDNLNSPTFGQLAVSVSSPGSGYILRAAEADGYVDACAIRQDRPPTPFPSVLPIRMALSFQNAALCLPRLTVTFDSLTVGQGGTSLVFEADRDSAEKFSRDNRSITLTPILPGNTGQAVIEWGGDFDFENRICSCCDIDDQRCDDPPESGWPLGEGEVSSNYGDPLGLVFVRPCAGTNENAELVNPNGGDLLYTPVYDENDEFVSWQLICGECDEAIEVAIGVYSLTPEPGPLSPSTRGDRGRTQCSCYPADAEQKCEWEPEIGEDGCWTGQYVLIETGCENPLP